MISRIISEKVVRQLEDRFDEIGLLHSAKTEAMVEQFLVKALDTNGILVVHFGKDREYFDMYVVPSKQ